MATFTLPDPYEGKSAEELRADCRRLSRAYFDMESMAKHLVSISPESVEKLPEPYRERMQRLIAAYQD